MERKVVSSDRSKEYTVTQEGNWWRCNCYAGLQGKECRHVRVVKNEGTMEINTNYIKFSGGGQEIDRVLEMDEELSIVVQGSVVKREQRSNQDGTVDMYYIVKPFNVSIGNET